MKLSLSLPSSFRSLLFLSSFLSGLTDYLDGDADDTESIDAAFYLFEIESKLSDSLEQEKEEEPEAAKSIRKSLSNFPCRFNLNSRKSSRHRWRWTGDKSEVIAKFRSSSSLELQLIHVEEGKQTTTLLSRECPFGRIQFAVSQAKFSRKVI